MQLEFVQDNLPIYYLEFSKTDTDFPSAQAVVNRLKALIDEHEFARFIAEFDHFSHTAGLAQGDIAPGLVDARNVIFCVGEQLASAESLALTPRSIGVAETPDVLKLSFLQVPQQQLNDTMQQWVNSLLGPSQAPLSPDAD